MLIFRPHDLLVSMVWVIQDKQGTNSQWKKARAPIVIIAIINIIIVIFAFGSKYPNGWKLKLLLLFILLLYW